MPSWRGLVRPPGHHAERGEAMGFCFFNNVAVVAAYLRSRGERVAVVDWDVHHGNGTQATFYRDPEVLYVSMHEFPFYPGTGSIGEMGAGAGEGATVNVPLARGTDADIYLSAFARIVIPVLEQFAADWIVVSNGYDAHRLDPLGSFLLESEHYGWMSKAVTDQVASGRVIAMLEGGYDLGALSASASATVDGLGGAVGDVVSPRDFKIAAGIGQAAAL
ncbi:MAG: histone deacetylase [Actinomycetota bacterium]|nr:histone deacetylase [Actinomycetota bacterium]MDK1016049.1 histone deacetylase [Actinomycetota bacterium]MDK1025868.1 histone deacetylase [Actinomycetota bacterium]MDK1039002.1 histone deacetylase [Actinomycetota bacterium]MDK1096937.1 histone deacetylase [Actinomycetota bacterium]